MDTFIVMWLLQSGLTTGAIYALLALALVLIFSVTRIIFVPIGEFVVYGALTVAAMQAGVVPATTWLLIAMGVVAFTLDAVLIMRRATGWSPAALRPLFIPACKYLAYPVAIHLLALGFIPTSPLGQIILALLIIVPMGPMLHRIAFQSIADASVLILLIAAIGVHLALLGLGLVMFGPDGFRTEPLASGSVQLFSISVASQRILIFSVGIALVVISYVFFKKTLLGRALRATAVNRTGAQLVGIGTAKAGRMALSLAAAVAILCGILIAPLSAVSYDTGFIIALKGFVGAIIGGLVSFPVAALGAVVIGLLEAVASFLASEYKEVIVFTAIIPILLFRAILVKQGDSHD